MFKFVKIYYNLFLLYILVIGVIRLFRNHTTPSDQLDNICAADYSEATVEWEEWTV